MENFIIYLLKLGVWIAVFWLIYGLFLRKETFFRFNRFFLLAGLPTSFALACCQYHYPVWVNLQLTVVPEGISHQAVQAGSTFSGFILFALVYALGVAVFLTHHLMGLNTICRLIRKRETKSATKPQVIEISAIQSSFSFFGYVFMDKTNTLSEVEKRLILAHETAHVEQRHWVDLFLIQIVCALQWFNPFVWLYRNAIKQNHEFLADRSVIQKGNSQAVYHAALINYTFKTPVFALANSFAYYNKFKRITMMKKNASKPAKKSAVLLLIPALALFLWAFAKPEYQYNLSSMPAKSGAYPGNDTIIVITDDTPEKTIVESSSTYKTLNDTIQAIIHGSSPDIGVRKKVKTTTFTRTKTMDENAVQTQKITIDIKDQTGDKVTQQTYVTCSDPYEAQKVADGKNVVVIGMGIQNKDSGATPLYIIDDKEVASLDDLEPTNIFSVSILKDESAMNVYGNKGKNGVILITTMQRAAENGESVRSREVTVKTSGTRGFAVKNIPQGTPKLITSLLGENAGQPLYIIDNKTASSGEFDALSPDKIESISILKGETAIKHYGEKGKNGVVIVETK
ncbi:MAG: hypothetical protein LBU22_08960 [Dysgonamonadaceae bacterium]|jgi:TonB-dependent SusC/RagA subfamily outer membrane receptor|nr:hypothetical protein [Dysgonamonadaceae bacterium]